MSEEPNLDSHSHASFDLSFSFFISDFASSAAASRPVASIVCLCLHLAHGSWLVHIVHTLDKCVLYPYWHHEFFKYPLPIGLYNAISFCFVRSCVRLHEFSQFVSRTRPERNVRYEDNSYFLLLVPKKTNE